MQMGRASRQTLKDIRRQMDTWLWRDIDAPLNLEPIYAPLKCIALYSKHSEPFQLSRLYDCGSEVSIWSFWPWLLVAYSTTSEVHGLPGWAQIRERLYHNITPQGPSRLRQTSADNPWDSTGSVDWDGGLLVRHHRFTQIFAEECSRYIIVPIRWDSVLSPTSLTFRLSI